MKPDPVREEWPLGGRADVDALARDAAVQGLNATELPIARAEELLGAVAGDALRATVRARAEQIIKYGHSLERDRRVPIGWLAAEAVARLQAARDVMIPGGRRDLKVARRRTAAVAAMCWALLDVIDAELGEG